MRATHIHPGRHPPPRDNGTAPRTCARKAWDRGDVVEGLSFLPVVLDSRDDNRAPTIKMGVPSPPLLAKRVRSR